VSALTQSTALWYASRATGIVALMLLSAVVALGIAVNRQGRLPGLPRFAVTGLHRSVALTAVVFVAIHVLTAVSDSYVSIRLIAVLIPFTSSYLPLELGFGAVALDLLVAVILTSLVRVRIGRTAWRGVHGLAYAAYPVAVLHSYTSATDLRSGALLALLISCVLAVACAIGWRLIATTRQRRSFRRESSQNRPMQVHMTLTSQGSPR
jgi:methionine sulfoxide reductase heme-binding subunit